MAELKNYSGPLLPDVKIEDFSKEALLKLVAAYAKAYIRSTGCFSGIVRELHGEDEWWRSVVEYWMRIGPEANLAVSKALDIEPKDIESWFKALQFDPGWPAVSENDLAACHMEMTGKSRGVHTLKCCKNALIPDMNMLLRICHGVEYPTFTNSARLAHNPNIMTRPLSLAPRQSCPGISCKWEYWLDGEEQAAGKHVSSCGKQKVNAAGELTDYSGPLVPVAKFEMFSKEVLVKLAYTYAWLYIRSSGVHGDIVRELHGDDEAWRCSVEYWFRMGPETNRLVCDALNIGPKNIESWFKSLQLDPGWPSVFGNDMGASHMEMTGKDRGTHTLQRCWALNRCESLGPYARFMTIRTCHGVEYPTFTNTARQVHDVNIMSKPLKLAPRKSCDEAACKWEYWLEPQ